ncbi:DUF808 domain-containing protein [Azospirillum sp. TSO22-1]|uniref:DUF808 domain-containing protein n=1 Tax=Azospirillum sp. TSO22-1 TaxID=716789 RepID=UPI000D616292|nr:DUF808 domain-containing protein [Azospirillum sp. TSO22-1]PWC32025.1 ABC transporter [Azospirillum sp. TSO22-1]
MSTGLIALLDDVAGLAKIAAASLDDTAVHVAKAGAKAAGIVVDDAAVTPRYVVGFTADRELPIVAKITVGSLKNKLLYLLPAALLLSLFAPWAITPLLMAGGAFLCYEGAEKVYEALWPHAEPHGPGGVLPEPGVDARRLEDEKVSGAIQTDLILSAEIMAITLSTVAAETTSFWEQAIILAIVGIGITLVVYGTVALIVKADDAGVALARYPMTRTVGRALVIGMPWFLKALSVIGTAAMLWVGGGIIIHGLETFGLPVIGHAIHEAAAAAGHAVPALGGVVEWSVSAAASGVFGLVLGALLIPLVHGVAQPVLAKLRS